MIKYTDKELRREAVWAVRYEATRLFSPNTKAHTLGFSILLNNGTCPTLIAHGQTATGNKFDVHVAI